MILLVVLVLVASAAFLAWRSSLKAAKDARDQSNKAAALWGQARRNWERAERLWAYSARLWEETGLIHQHARGEWAQCGACGQKIPLLALKPTDGVLTCARCSPEARVAGRFVEQAGGA